ncbi:MAG: hypothetical protein ACI4F4_08520 [Lachnospiraceae bacterium]
MKNRKKVTAVFLAGLLVITALPTSVFAASENTGKEEVVYTNLNSDGSVKEINVVNIFDLKEKGTIIDYGKYVSLRNMTTTDTIDYKDHTVTIEADKGKLYYEGKLEENEIPWNIEIHYLMDGKEYAAEEIAGMSGNLEIKMSIRQNRKCDSSFFEGYALQTTFILDTNCATDIKAEGATIANVGSDKQITFTILPNNEKNLIVSAKVENFEMTGISINGIRMDLDMDIDDATLQEKIDEVIRAVNDLDEGAGALNDGASSLYGAAGKLNSAAESLHTGTGSLYEGATRLQNGLAALSSKNGELTAAAWSAFEGLCSAAQTQLNGQLTANGMEAVTLTPSTYQEVLMQVLAQMDADAAYTTAYNTALAEVTAQVEAQADTLYSEYIRSQSDAICLAYVQSDADNLYNRVATQAVLQQLMESGMTQEQANAYLQTQEGRAMIAATVAAMTEEQKEQILLTAVQSLTPDQREQILQGAIASLTEEQKEQIRNVYIQQVMASDEITGRINEAVEAVSAAGAQVSALMGQLNNFGAFYNGLVNYTNGVSDAANGASELAKGLSTLSSSTETFHRAIGDLQIAIGKMKDGTNDLKNGTGEFVEETSNINTEVDESIDDITSSLTGSDVETISFVSKQNTNIQSVLFVLQTESIEIDDAANKTIEETEALSFWEKLVKLFH